MTRAAGLASLTNVVAAPARHPFAFEDMMAMKHLGETGVSPDGEWLAYSVTTVDLAQNTKTPELWLQAIAGGEPFKLATGQQGDSDPQFSADSKRILWISGRQGGKQVWVGDFDAATGVASKARKLTAIATEAGSPKWSSDGKSISRSCSRRRYIRTARRSVLGTAEPETAATRRETRLSPTAR